MNATLDIGVAVEDITPPVGSLMAAFPRGPERIPRRAEGVHDPLKARVLVLSDERTTMALCSCDLCLMQAIDVQRIREMVAKECPDLGGPRLVVACTHTHSSMETTYLFGGHPEDAPVKAARRKIAAAVIEAAANRRPCRVNLGRVKADLTHNRRVLREGRSQMQFTYEEGVTEGPADSEIVALGFETLSGELQAILYNLAAHGVTVGPANSMFSADYPGAVERAVQRTWSAVPVLLLNGAAGNVHPRQSMRPDFDTMDAVGDAVACAVLDALGTASLLDDSSLDFRSTSLSFSNRVDPEVTTSVELSVFRVGPLVAACVPGEPFIEFQLRFKAGREPSPAMFIGYANGSCGYIPTREAYREGGYGVDLYTGDPPALSRTALPAGAGERILAALERMVGEMQSDRGGKVQTTGSDRK